MVSPLCGLHGYYSSEQTLWLVGSRVGIGVLRPWVEADRRRGRGGVGWGKHGISLTSDSSGADERRARRTLLAVSFFARRHADWLICSLTHLVNWNVSHFKSYVRNDASCVACYTRLGGSERKRRRSKLSACVCKILETIQTEILTEKFMISIFCHICEFPALRSGVALM